MRWESSEWDDDMRWRKFKESSMGHEEDSDDDNHNKRDKKLNITNGYEV